MIIFAKFQVPSLNRLREIARTPPHPDTPTDPQTHRENSKTEQPYFWFWENHLV